MDMRRVNKLGGMPAGFPFAMVLIGVAAAVGGAVLAGINEYFFRELGGHLVVIGAGVVTAGAFLQSVRWVCEAFGRGTPPPPTA